MTVSESHHTDSSANQSAGSRWSSRNLARDLTVCLGLGLMVAALFGRLMSYKLRHDELMFVPPAELLPGWQLYSDFFYNHVPYSAWYYFASARVFEGYGLLGSARIGVFLAWLILLAATGLATYRISRSGRLALFSVVALLTCETLLSQAGMAATNNLLPLAFAALGLGLFIAETRERDVSRTRLVLAGFCLSIAAGMKVSAFMFIPPVAIGAFFLPATLPFADRLRRVVTPLLIGGLIGALPLFWYMLSDPALFLSHIVKFHTGPHVAYWQANAASEPGLALGLTNKVQMAYSVWLAGSGLVMTMVLFYLTWSAIHEPRDKVTGHQQGWGQIAVVLGVLALTAVMSFVPTPSFPQYFIQPLVCLPILIALSYRLLPKSQGYNAGLVMAAGIIVMIVLGLPRLGPGVLALKEPQKFTSARIAKDAETMRAFLAESSAGNGPVATLVPLYPLEAGLPVYPEFATGPFAFRIAPYTSPELASRYRMIDAGSVAALLDELPPAAFLLGYYPELEQPLFRYAKENGYRKADISSLDNRYGQGVVYFKKEEASK